MKLVKSIFVLLGGLLSFLPLSSMASSALVMDHTKPQMLKDKFYKEYWEQHFLFDDGTFVTSQFLVANFPWPVGKEHGIMIATVVRPDGKRTIIKNGRSLGEWGFDPEKFNLFIHTHRLKQEGDKHDIHIGKADQNTVDVSGISTIPPIDHARFDRKKKFVEASYYLPYFIGEGSWKVWDDQKKSFVGGAGRVQGFGTHVLFNGRVEELLNNWLRVCGLRGEDNNQLLPFISAMERPDGSRDIIVTLKNATEEVTRFSHATIEYKDIIQENKRSSYPTVIEVTANNGAESLTGTIRFTRKIDHFNINDHMNFFERSFAKFRGSVSNYRYIADYDLNYTTATGTEKLTGKALGEYQDVLPPKKKKKNKRRKR